MYTLRFTPFVILLSIGSVYVNAKAEAIHFPLLISMLAGVAIGLLVPHKGWILAIMQILLIGVFYGVLNIYFTDSIVNIGIAQFTTLFSALTTFSGSFLGSFIKRTLQSN